MQNLYPNLKKKGIHWSPAQTLFHLFLSTERFSVDVCKDIVYSAWGMENNVRI